MQDLQMYKCQTGEIKIFYSKIWVLLYFKFENIHIRLTCVIRCLKSNKIISIHGKEGIKRKTNVD